MPVYMCVRVCCVHACVCMCACACDVLVGMCVRVFESVFV